MKKILVVLLVALFFSSLMVSLAEARGRRGQGQCGPTHIGHKHYRQCSGGGGYGYGHNRRYGYGYGRIGINKDLRDAIIVTKGIEVGAYVFGKIMDGITGKPEEKTVVVYEEPSCEEKYSDSAAIKGCLEARADNEKDKVRQAKQIEKQIENDAYDQERIHY